MPKAIREKTILIILFLRDANVLRKSLAREVNDICTKL